MANKLSEMDWKMLLGRIRDGRCTPFIGAGVNFGVLPLGADIAKRWAEAYNYPMDDSGDLARVAQFVAINAPDQMFAKELIAEDIKKVAPPDFLHAPDNLLSVLADLPFSVYITTNYDDFIMKALEAKGKHPRREMCGWNDQVPHQSAFDSSAYEPNKDNPVVYHLHGHQDTPESIVLTEDDYLNFLVQISKDDKLLPPRIQKAFTGASLMFVGYRMADWDFRVLFRGLVTSMAANLRRISIAVQLPPQAGEVKGAETQDYLTRYFQAMAVQVYWGTALEFAAELRERWTEFSK